MQDIFSGARDIILSENRHDPSPQGGSMTLGSLQRDMNINQS